ncbi:nucleolysin TIA-1/TIAR [Entomortierella parvispora]|uniref:Nucleolysin TIA-1/TIAR n=1 Tax=Entomortierella parvispora TaxID=205924 RepID=A0A9P3LZL2_9FUNG|nr:nucleolysin TIA-1/TIAR [Entomortierella parvispora]
MDQFAQNQDPASQQVASAPASGMATASPSASNPNAPASVGSSSGASAPAFQPDENSKTLYVGNLDQGVNEVALQEIFSQTGGQVESVKIIRDKNFAHQGGLNYGFVEYSSHEEAEMALQNLNGRRIYAHEIKVNWAFTGQVAGKEDTASHYHIFIGDISPEINDEALSKAFGVFGTMTDARVMWDANSGKSRGYGFAAFKERADAERAIMSMTGQVLGNRPIRCNWASQRGMPGPAFNHQGMHHGNFKMVAGQAPQFNTTVYIGNLPPQTTQEDLMPFFQPFGFVVDMRLQADRGFAFVKMETHEKAATAIVRLAGTMINGRLAKFSWGKDRSAENAARNNHYGYYNNGAGYPMGGPQNNGAYPYSYNNNNNNSHHHHHHQNNGNNGHHYHNNNHNNNGGLQNHYGGGNGQGYGRAGPPHHPHHQQQQQHHVPPPQHLHQQPQMNKA